LKAYDDWRRQLEGIPGVLLEGRRLSPPQWKGLLNREAHVKERYDRERARLLGLSDVVD